MAGWEDHEVSFGQNMFDISIRQFIGAAEQAV